MTIDGLIAILGLMLAAYAIMPETRRLELRFRFKLLDWIAVIAALLVIVYLQCYSIFAAINLTPGLHLSRWNVSPERVSFFVAAGVMLLVSVHLRYSRLSTRHINRFSSLVDQLLSSERYRDVVILLRRNFSSLVDISRGDNTLSRLRQFLKPPVNDWLYLSGIKEKKFRQIPRALKQPAALLSRLIPDYSKEHDNGLHLLQRLLTTREIAVAVAKFDPYFGLSILDTVVNHRDSFLDNYISALIKDPTSNLNYEIRNCPELPNARGYGINESHQLLTWLFKDVSRAQRAEVYRPVGETIIAELEQLRRKPETDPYNFVADRAFEESGCWESPILIGIIFFDIMVTSAFQQDIVFHMWLYYFTYFAKGIIENCSPNDPAIAPNEGSSTRYGHFLRQLFFKLRGWGGLATSLPDISEQDGANLDRSTNIPSSSLSALAQCFHYLLASEKFEARFKDEIGSVVFGLYFDLRYAGKHHYALMLTRLLRRNAFSYVDDKPYYQDELLRIYDAFDKVPHRMRNRQYLDELTGEIRR